MTRLSGRPYLISAGAAFGMVCLLIAGAVGLLLLFAHPRHWH